MQQSGSPAEGLFLVLQGHPAREPRCVRLTTCTSKMSRPGALILGVEAVPSQVILDLQEKEYSAPSAVEGGQGPDREQRRDPEASLRNLLPVQDDLSPPSV